VCTRYRIGESPEAQRAGTAKTACTSSKGGHRLGADAELGNPAPDCRRRGQRV